MQKELEVKKRNLLILMILSLLAVSCTFGPPDPNQWLRGKTFSGPAVSIENKHGLEKKTDIPIMYIQFTGNAEYELYKMKAKDKLEHTYTANSCDIKGIVIDEGKNEFYLEIHIKALPKSKIEYKEKMTLLSDSQHFRTVEGTLNEMM